MNFFVKKINNENIFKSNNLGYKNYIVDSSTKKCGGMK